MLASDLTRGMSEDKGTNILIRKMQKDAPLENQAGQDALLAKELELPAERARTQAVCLAGQRETCRGGVLRLDGHYIPWSSLTDCELRSSYRGPGLGKCSSWNDSTAGSRRCPSNHG